MKRLLAMALALSLPASAQAAVQGEVDEKFKIPVPQVQRKIKQGGEKAFEDGALRIFVRSAERSGAIVSFNDGSDREVPHSKPFLVKIEDGRICTVVYLGLVGKRAAMSARCDPGDANMQAALEAQENAGHVEVIDPIELVANAEKGALENPYLGDPAAIAEGHELFLANSCNGCHGGTGGGGMGPPMSNGVWVYGKEDDTLFRLVTLGSDGLQEQGYSRVAREIVVGPMPPYEGIIENADELWKILAWVRSISPSDAPPLK